MTIEELVIRRTLRVPTPQGPEGDGAAVTRQFDAVLMSAGFKLSDQLFTTLSGLDTGAVMDTAVAVLGVVRRMVGDHVQHNVYFRDFPRNVPDTIEFWTECLIEALADPAAAEQVGGDVLLGTLNLLGLPKYGRYQHSYLEMLGAHSEFIEGAGDRVTVLQAGGTVAAEACSLYNSLASATTPGNDEDREALKALALACIADKRQPQQIPVRENRALINEVRLSVGADLLVDTVTDVLRLACTLSDGDVTLVETTRFRALRRPVRRALLSALDAVVHRNPAALGDVHQYRERWKRLGERLHPHEFPQWPKAAEVFAVARGEQAAPSLMATIERLIDRGETVAAATLLQKIAPGMLFRSADRLLRYSTPVEQKAVADIITASAGSVSGRVLLSLREHLGNRLDSGQRRVFVNRTARGHVENDTRMAIDTAVIDHLTTALDDEVRRRMPIRLVVDPDLREVALPLSGKAVAGGFGTLPRGSVSPVTGELLRFFIYWRETEQTTDFDLSALMFDRGYRNVEWLSYTNLRGMGGAHSGDITSAPNGASEFIDLDLTRITADVVIPQVNVYSGEGFEEVAESFFGFMLRDRAQEGQPFEPRTVRMKSELRGAGRVALPLAFVRSDEGWRAVWLHLHLSGTPAFNQVENNRVTTQDLVRATLGRRYLTLGYLADLLGAPEDGEPVTYVGVEDPGNLPTGSVVVTPASLGDLIPG